MRAASKDWHVAFFETATAVASRVADGAILTALLSTAVILNRRLAIPTSDAAEPNRQADR